MENGSIRRGNSLLRNGLFWGIVASESAIWASKSWVLPWTALHLERAADTASLVAHDCGYPLSRYTCRATPVATDFLDFIAFCRCSTGVALHPLKILVSHLPPPLCAGRCRTEIWVWKGVALHGGVAATVAGVALHCATKTANHSGTGQTKPAANNVRQWNAGYQLGP